LPAWSFSAGNKISILSAADGKRLLRGLSFLRPNAVPFASGAFFIRPHCRRFQTISLYMRFDIYLKKLNLQSLTFIEEALILPSADQGIILIAR